MKTIPSGLLAHYASGSTRLALAVRITRSDGEVIGMTSHERDHVIGGVTYIATHGLETSQVITTAGLAVDNLEMRTLDDGTIFDRADVLGGRWNGARFLIFRYCWADISLGTEPLMAGVFGNVTLQQGSIVAELRGMQQYLQQAVSNVTTKTCRARLADYPTPNGKNLCRLDAEDWLESGTVTAVTSRAVFAASGIANANTADYYGEGVLTWVTGGSAGLRQKVRTHATGGVFTLILPMKADIEVGDTFEVIAGCRGRLQEDCRDKFDNVVNFQGEPHLPGVDALTAAPDVSA